MYGGGQEEQLSPFSALKVGMNEGVTLKLEYEESVTLGEFTGQSLTLHVTVNGATNKMYLTEVQADKVQPREVKNVMQTKEEAVKEKVSTLMANIKQLVTGYGITDEAWVEATSKPVATFKEFMKIIFDLLPKDYSTKPGKLILISNKKGYPRLPYSIKNTNGRWWLADGVEGKEISVPAGKYFDKFFARNQEQAADTKDKPEDDTVW